MQQTEQQSATVILLRRDRFDARAKKLGLENDAACAEYIGVDRATVFRIRKGETLPGERFIAACLKSKFARSFEALFEIGEAS